MADTSPPNKPDPDFLVVGHLNKVHGVKGELYVWSLTDDPDRTFREGRTLHVSDVEGRRPSDRFPRIEVEAARAYKRGLLVKFSGIDDRDEAERLKGRYLLVPFEEARAPDEGEVFYHQLLGMRVESADGRPLGVVREVYELGYTDLLEVRGAAGTFHVPFAESMVSDVDVERRRLVLDPPEGLLDA